MSKYISILRGINVGGKRKILMTDLKALYSKLGFNNIITYIQSGNVIFEANDTSNIAEMENKIAQEISTQYGFDVPVIIRTMEAWNTAINENPFFDENIDIKQFHLTILKEIPNPELVHNLSDKDYAPDKIHIHSNHVYIQCEGKYHQSKLTNNFIEKKLQTSATTRNWKTVLKINELL